MIGLAMMTGHSYYQEQYYNHLPSVIQQQEETPAAIQHYEDMRDKLSVPEENNVSSNASCGNNVCDTGEDSVNCVNDCGMNIEDFFNIYSDIPTNSQVWNRVIWITALLLGLWMFQGRRRLFGMRVIMPAAILMLAGLAAGIVIIIPNSFMWQLAIAFGVYTVGSIFSGVWM
jgi:hypothetical protein